MGCRGLACHSLCRAFTQLCIKGVAKRRAIGTTWEAAERDYSGSESMICGVVLQVHKGNRIDGSMKEYKYIGLQRCFFYPVCIRVHVFLWLI